MPCLVPLQPKTPAELVRTPFLYPARAQLGGARRLIVEVGPGRGDFLFHLAAANPEASVVGIEIKRKRVDKLIARTEKRGLTNIALIQDDARCAIPRLGEASVDEIHVQFPDPWPKNRHEKNRSLSPAFLESCRRVLKICGTIAILTDSEPYAVAVAANAAQIVGLEAIEVAEGDFDAITPTFFSEKWKADGRRCYVRKYRRIT